MTIVDNASFRGVVGAAWGSPSCGSLGHKENDRAAIFLDRYQSSVQNLNNGRRGTSRCRMHAVASLMGSVCCTIHHTRVPPLKIAILYLAGVHLSTLQKHQKKLVGLITFYALCTIKTGSR